MKKFFILILLFILLFSFTTVASAEMLFGVSAETGSTDFSADYKSSPPAADISKSSSMLMLNGDLNLILLHIYLGYGKADIDQSTFSTINALAGWELGPKILKAKIFGGYQALNFSDANLTIGKDNVYASLVAGLGVESMIDKFGFYGNIYLPLTTNYTNGINEDNNASLNYLKLGVSYAPLPLIDLFVNYQDMKAESNVVNIANKGYTAGVKISF